MNTFSLNEIDQIKLYPPGAQKIYDHIVSCNSLYFCYCTTISAIIYNRSNNKMDSILCPTTDYFLRTAALNKGAKNDLALFSFNEIVIYDLITKKPQLRFPSIDVFYLEFNTGSKLLSITDKGDLSFVDLSTSKDAKTTFKPIKTADKVVMAQWYPFTTSDLAYITNKNEVYFQSILSSNQISSISLEIAIRGQDSNFQITEMAWYDADDNYKYLLIGTDTSYIVLVDLSEKSPMIISSFDHYGNGIKRLMWLTYEPGSFLSITKNSGRISTWNASKSSYNQVFKLTDFAIKDAVKYDNETLLFSTSKGEVILFNMKQNKRTFHIDSGHCESIFDVKFSPLTYGLFATCSYDGSIKVWDMLKSSLLLTLYLDLNVNQAEKAKEERVNVHCLKWSPNDKQLIASGDSMACLKIWDIDKEKLVASLRFDSKAKKEFEVFGVDWSKDDQIICGCLMKVYVNEYANGKFSTVKVISGDQSVFQIKFNPHAKKEIGVACKDGVIRAYNILNEKSDPIRTYTGHKQKVFGLAYSTSSKLMASASDDFAVGIWDLTKAESQSGNNFLLGHTDNVRSLVWLEQSTNVLISGSWDSTIRFWNVKQMLCLGVINEHLSDVYGLDICPNHPFLIISASRDNTIRLWNYSHHALSVLTDFLSGDSVIAPNLFQVESTSDIPRVSFAERVAKCYYYEDGVGDFWRMAHHIYSSSSSSLASGLANEYVDYVKSIKEIENSYFNTSKIDYTKRKEDILRELIDRCAKSGQWRKYCEFCIKVNDWESAIMSAPHVSIDYWRHLTNKYADHCLKSNFNSETRLSSMLLSDNVDLMIKELFDRGEYEDAKLIWITRAKKERIIQEEIDIELQTEVKQEVLHELSEQVVDPYKNETQIAPMLATLVQAKLIEGKPLQGAYHYLSINDIGSAIKVLVQAQLIEMAFLLMKTFNCYSYEGDVIHGLFDKKKDKASPNDLCSLISQCHYLRTKATLHQRILSTSSSMKIAKDLTLKLNEDVKNSSDSLLQALMQNNLDEIRQIALNARNELLSLIAAKDSSVTKAFNQMLSVYLCLRGIELKDDESLFIPLVLCAGVMDVINANSKGAKCLMSQFIQKASNPSLKYQYDLNDYVALRFSYDYLKNGLNGCIECHWISKAAKDFIEKTLSQSQVIHEFKAEYFKSLQTELGRCKEEGAKCYRCEGMSQKFYHIKREDFPKNLNVYPEGQASLSENLELHKYSCQ